MSNAVEKVEQKQKTTARRASRCSACHAAHIRVGDTIVKFRASWAHPTCVERVYERNNLVRRVEVEMIERHQIALGCWGIPPHCRPTFTRAEWLGLAVSHHACTPLEAETLTRAWAGILHRDLSD